MKTAYRAKNPTGIPSRWIVCTRQAPSGACGPIILRVMPKCECQFAWLRKPLPACDSDRSYPLDFCGERHTLCDKWADRPAAVSTELAVEWEGVRGVNQRRERAPDPCWARHSDGRGVSPLLDSCPAPPRATESGLPTGPGAAVGRRPRRLPRWAGTRGLDRREVRPPPCLVVLRAQRAG